MDKTSLGWLAVSMLPDIGPNLGVYLHKNRYDPLAFWQADYRELIDGFNASSQLARKIVAAKKSVKAEKCIDKLSAAGLSFVTIADEDFPKTLRQINDPPVVLYYKGNLEVVDNRCFAIVGARKASSYGREAAEYFAEKLTSRGLLIVSGMARGIDTYAHTGALKKGKTAAVLGCRIESAYPARNKELCMQIVDSGGCVMSEYPPGTPPAPYRFPARNRIVSGLCEAVLVVEANERSGALITADLALSQGREVIAVPGNIGSPLSRGPHKLIKAGAMLAEHPDDVLELLKIGVGPHKKKNAVDTTDLTDQERGILKFISWSESHVDRIAADAKTDIGSLLSVLTSLEIKGLVIKTAGNHYCRATVKP